jgi:hypothetical protein
MLFPPLLQGWLNHSPEAAQGLSIVSASSLFDGTVPNSFIGVPLDSVRQAFQELLHNIFNPRRRASPELSCEWAILAIFWVLNVFFHHESERARLCFTSRFALISYGLFLRYTISPTTGTKSWWTYDMSGRIMNVSRVRLLNFIAVYSCIQMFRS